MRKMLQDFTLKELTNHCENHDKCIGCKLRKIDYHICEIIGLIYLMADGLMEKKFELDTRETK